MDQGYTGEQAQTDAGNQGVVLEVVKLPDVKRGFVLLPRRWVVERSFAWLTRFRRLVRDYERLPQVLSNLHFVAFAMIMLSRVVAMATQSAQQALSEWLQRWIESRGLKENDLLFPYHSRPIRKELLESRFREGLENAGVQVGEIVLSTYSLRYSFHSATEGRLTAETIQRMIGHKSGAMSEY